MILNYKFVILITLSENITAERVDYEEYTDLIYHIDSVTTAIEGRYFCQVLCSNNAMYTSKVKVYSICK